MARVSPLLALPAFKDSALAPYGPESSDIRLVQAIHPVRIEYATIRSLAAAFDEPHRATLVVTGADRLPFLNRMLTQELAPAKGFAPFTARSSFWLNRKGRIDADLRVIHLPDRLILQCDIFAAERALAGLNGYVITEDVTITDATEQHHTFSLHGPSAAAILDRESTPVAGSPIATIPRGHASIITIADAEVIVDRDDLTGELGLRLTLPVAAAPAVFEKLTGHIEKAPAATNDQRKRIAPSQSKALPIGWHALNTARIEAGSALYYADFGPDSLPAETGILSERVSFTKGCYLGQEVVARMNALGHPKQKLVALKIEESTDASSTPDPNLRDSAAPADAYHQQAVTGTPVLSADTPDAPVIGAVTSSCLSPRLKNTPIAFAMLKWSHTPPGTKVYLQLDGTRQAATVQSNLSFLPSPN
jgi:folate-binding protein YgfZ